ncbi:MAG: glycine cleavage system protein R [Halioglobus sp.]
MDTAYIVTFIGDDRPGLVEELAGVIETIGGNWLESKLSQLGGKFAGLILVSCPSVSSETLHKALEAQMGGQCSIRVTATGEATQAAHGRDITLSVMGPDRQGIVKEVSSALAQRQINVVRLNSDVVSAPMSAELLFQAQIEARIPEGADIDQLGETLDEIANQMTLEIDWS